MASSPREENRVPGLVAKSDADNTPVILEADPATKRLKVNATITGGAGGGPATIADGADVAEGATTDAAVTAGAAGTVSGKLRQISADISNISSGTSGLALDSTLDRVVSATTAPPWFQRSNNTLRVDISSAVLTGVTIGAVTTITSVTNIVGMGGIDPKLTQINDGAKNMWANAVRSNVA